jgi:hypothetical protein
VAFAKLKATGGEYPGVFIRRFWGYKGFQGFAVCAFGSKTKPQAWLVAGGGKLG